MKGRSVGRSVFPLLFVLTWAFTASGQGHDGQLNSIKDPKFEIVGYERLGPHKASRSLREIASLIVVYSPKSHAREPHLSLFVKKIKLKIQKSESYFIYFLDDREKAKRLVELVKLDSEKEGEMDRLLDSIRAVFTCLKEDGMAKESLRLFENGMTKKDLDSLGLESEN